MTMLLEARHGLWRSLGARLASPNVLCRAAMGEDSGMMAVARPDRSPTATWQEGRAGWGWLQG